MCCVCRFVSFSVCFVHSFDRLHVFVALLWCCLCSVFVCVYAFVAVLLLLCAFCVVSLFVNLCVSVAMYVCFVVAVLMLSLLSVFF